MNATTQTTGFEQQIEMARELWALQRRATELAVTLSVWQQQDESLSRTLGDEGEYFEVNTGDFTRLCRSVASRLDRTVAFNS